MSDQHKPLTAGEIEELKALEAQASKGTWVVEKPFSHPGVQAVKTDGSFDWICHAQVSNMPGWLKDSVFIAAMRNAIPRLLSMLTPPTDAEVREAVEELERKLAWLRSHPKEESANVGIVQLRIDLDILLSYVRAVQAPRLTPEQVEAAFREGYGLGNDDGRNIDVFCHIKQHKPESDPDFAWEYSEARRAAFPELAGEVKRG